MYAPEYTAWQNWPNGRRTPRSAAPTVVPLAHPVWYAEPATPRSRRHSQHQHQHQRHATPTWSPAYANHINASQVDGEDDDELPDLFVPHHDAHPASKDASHGLQLHVDGTKAGYAPTYSWTPQRPASMLPEPVSQAVVMLPGYATPKPAQTTTLKHRSRSDVMTTTASKALVRVDPIQQQLQLQQQQQQQLQAAEGRFNTAAAALYTTYVKTAQAEKDKLEAAEREARERYTATHRVAQARYSTSEQAARDKLERELDDLRARELRRLASVVERRSSLMGKIKTALFGDDRDNDDDDDDDEDEEMQHAPRKVTRPAVPQNRCIVCRDAVPKIPWQTADLSNKPLCEYHRYQWAHGA